MTHFANPTEAHDKYRCDVDLFSQASLLNPYTDYRQLRDIGRVAYLQRLDMWAVTRYDEVRQVLSTPETFSSAQGIGMNNTINTAWKDVAPSLDGAEHLPLRRIMMQSIGPKAVQQYQGIIEEVATLIVEEVVDRGEFDAVVDLAQRLPATIVLDLIGLSPDEQTRYDLLHWATDSYNCCGPDGTFDDTLPSMEKLYGYVAANMTPERLRPGSIGAQTWAAAESGKIVPEQAMGILVGYATAGLDTTASAIGSLIMLFGQNPDQWSLVREDPTLVPAAALEGVRVESPAQWFTRVTMHEIEFDDVTLPAGTRLLHSYGAANRDERHYSDPDRFDVRRNPTDTLAFGYGPHSCMGKSMSNLEVHALFRALAQRVERIELTGEPVRHVNNLIRSLEHLPVRAHRR